MKRIGFWIGFDLEDENDQWADEACATAWLAAAGGNFTPAA